MTRTAEVRISISAVKVGSFSVNIYFCVCSISFHAHMCTHRYELTGGEIAQALCSAAEEVATDSTGLTQGHLIRAAEGELSRRNRFTAELSLFR